MKAKETAVVFIEFQNEFCKEDGKLHDGVKDEMARQGTIPNAVKLADGTRAKGATVIHSPFIFNADYFEKYEMQGIIKAAAEGDAFRADTWGGAIIDELAPKDGDEVITGKCTLSGFNNTDLQKILDKHGIKNVVVAGFLSNVCVESTARAAYDRGYRVTIVSDATSANSQMEQEYVEQKIYPLLGGSMTVDEFLAQLDA